MKKILALTIGLTIFGSALTNVKQMTMDPKTVVPILKHYLPTNEPIKILEAGAFDGNDTVYLHNTWTQGTIFSFEPVPEIFGWLEKKTKGLDRVFRYQVALSDKTGEATFSISEAHNRNWDGLWASGSLLPPKEHLTYSPQVEFKTTITVPTVSLDEWAEANEVDSLDLLWLDMQGVELNVLKASKIALTAKVIYTEIEFVEAYEGQYLYADIKKWMEENGYELVAKDWPTPRPKNVWFGNGIYVKKELLS